MSDDKSKTHTGRTQESYHPRPTEERGYTPLTQRPSGEVPNFTPPTGGSGAPSGGGSQSQPTSTGGGESAGGGEKK